MPIAAGISAIGIAPLDQVPPTMAVIRTAVLMARIANSADGLRQASHHAQAAPMVEA
jgi:hypothetical protein